MPKIIIALAVFVCLCTIDSFAQIEPAVGIRENTPTVHALKNLTIIVAPGRKIEKGTIVVRDGVIESAGSNVSIPADARVLVVDDLLATGGTVKAVIELLRLQHANIVGVAFVVELQFLKGKDKFKDLSIYSVIQF